jgi:hypothetical protein
VSKERWRLVLLRTYCLVYKGNSDNHCLVLFAIALSFLKVFISFLTSCRSRCSSTVLNLGTSCRSRDCFKVIFKFRISKQTSDLDEYSPETRFRDYNLDKVFSVDFRPTQEAQTRMSEIKSSRHAVHIYEYIFCLAEESPT